MSNVSEHSSVETSPKHLRATSGQAENADDIQASITDSPSKAQDDCSGKFFLKLIGVIVVIIVVISIGATSCGTAMKTVRTDSGTNGGSSQEGDSPSDAESDGSSVDRSGSDSGGHSSTRDYSNDYSYDYSDKDYSSTDDDYQRVYDEDSGIYGVIGEDGDGIFAGENFGMRLNEDGSSIATDGNGNWVVDSDGDGEVDAISIDGGNSWF